MPSLQGPGRAQGTATVARRSGARQCDRISTGGNERRESPAPRYCIVKVGSGFTKNPDHSENRLGSQAFNGLKASSLLALLLVPNARGLLRHLDAGATFANEQLSNARRWSRKCGLDCRITQLNH